MLCWGKEEKVMSLKNQVRPIVCSTDKRLAVPAFQARRAYSACDVVAFVRVLFSASAAAVGQLNACLWLTFLFFSRVEHVVKAVFLVPFNSLFEVFIFDIEAPRVEPPVV